MKGRPEYHSQEFQQSFRQTVRNSEIPTLRNQLTDILNALDDTASKTGGAMMVLGSFAGVEANVEIRLTTAHRELSVMCLSFDINTGRSSWFPVLNLD